MAKHTAPFGAAAILRGLMQKLNTWLIVQRDRALLAAKTPDQREDLGLSLRDMNRLSA